MNSKGILMVVLLVLIGGGRVLSQIEADPSTSEKAVGEAERTESMLWKSARCSR